MRIVEEEILVGPLPKGTDAISHFSHSITERLPAGAHPIRLAVTKTDDAGFHCEVATLQNLTDAPAKPSGGFFDFQRRRYENTDEFNAILLIPTGIGAEIGGHSGDAGPLARLLGEACDRLILHPNVVNASDINETPENGLYVEGSIIARLLMGTIALAPVRSNRVLVVMDDNEDDYINDAVVNSVSAARAAMGLHCPAVVRLSQNLRMRSLYASSGRAVGDIEHFSAMSEVLTRFQGQYDAVAVSSMIDVPAHFHADYYRDEMEEMINPWGGVEAMLTHAVSTLFDVPSAHSPMASAREDLEISVGVVDPRKAAEAVSTTFLHCILKGLHRSPRIVPNTGSFDRPGLVSVENVSCLVIPDGCVGIPTLAALAQEIPVIAVRGNRNCMQNDLRALPFAAERLFVVENYLEAVGVMTALKSGVAVDTVCRPINKTPLLS